MLFNSAPYLLGHSQNSYVTSACHSKKPPNLGLNKKHIQFHSGNPIRRQMNQNAWLVEFKEQLQGLEAFYAEMPREESLLRFAFSRDLLKEDLYLQWAQKHFGLPLLKAPFFVDITPNTQLWQKYHEKFTWSPELLPVAEWDGHLIIACLNPETFFANPYPGSILLIADSQSLQKRYEFYQSQISEASPKSFSAPAASTTMELELQDEPEEHISDEELEKLESESPDGMEVHLDGISLEIPEGITLDSKTETPTSVGLSFASLRPATTVDTATATASASTSPLPPPPPAEASEAIRPIPHTPQLVVNNDASPTPGANSTIGYSLEPWSKDFLQNETVKAFQKMKSHFEKTLILSISDDESKAKVQFWDENFKKPQEERLIPLKTPSIFNIVAQTVKPFHGPVSLNEVNERFFDSWNHSQIPSHVTITPIVVKDRLVGMIMGFSNSQSYNKATLNYAEKVSHEIANDLQKAAA